MIAYEFAIISGFVIGILGSFHCIGMCGPLALSLPTQNLSPLKKANSIFAYNIGRAFSYSLIGLFFGFLGMSFQLFKLQQALSIGAGFLLLLIVFSFQFNFLKFSAFSKASQFLKYRLSTFLKSEKSVLNFFYIGIANGFLPCGLVYAALIPAITYGSAFKTSLSMFGFGLGTIPIMAFTMIAGRFISIPIRKAISTLSPYIIASIAILLILRGLNLDIPMISPKAVENKVSCCHKN